MMYQIKAIPTVYNRVQFRSRLEARWAAFFDLSGIKWDYEPFDLEGWTPDFVLPDNEILVEVKPIDFSKEITDEEVACVAKAASHATKYNVLLLGTAPLNLRSIGVSLEGCPLVAVKHGADLWREAGNDTQWHPKKDRDVDFYSQLRTIFHRKAA